MSKKNYERVEIKTDDGVLIVGDFAAVSDSENAVLLLHMMPSTRKSFGEFQELLAKKGLSSLAVDLRGHGESVRRAVQEEQKLDYRYFSDAKHQQSIYDARAAVSFLLKRGIKKISLVGASIGANFSLAALAENPQLSGAIILSAGYNYRGIETLPLAKKLHLKQRVFFVAAEDDGNAAKMAQGLYDSVRADIKKSIRIFKNGGHGTDLFINQPQFMEECAGWLKEVF